MPHLDSRYGLGQRRKQHRRTIDDDCRTDAAMTIVAQVPRRLK